MSCERTCCILCVRKGMLLISDSLSWPHASLVHTASSQESHWRDRGTIMGFVCGLIMCLSRRGGGAESVSAIRDFLCRRTLYSRRVDTGEQEVVGCRVR